MNIYTSEEVIQIISQLKITSNNVKNQLRKINHYALKKIFTEFQNKNDTISYVEIYMEGDGYDKLGPISEIWHLFVILNDNTCIEYIDEFNWKHNKKYELNFKEYDKKIYADLQSAINTIKDKTKYSFYRINDYDDDVDDLSYVNDDDVAYVDDVYDVDDVMNDE
jgi:hypothetical protein